MRSVLEEIAVTVFRAQFVRFEGESALEDSELGPIPQGWRVDELGAHLDVIETGSRPEGGVKSIESGVPSIGAESIVGVGKFDFSKT